MNAAQLRSMMTAPPATAGSPVTFWVEDGDQMRQVRFLAWDKIVPTVTEEDGQKKRQTGPTEIRVYLTADVPFHSEYDLGGEG